MEFGICDEQNMKRIAEITGVGINDIKKLRDSFSKIFLEDSPSAFEFQYLAHLVRSMESYIRKELKDHRFFRIELQPIDANSPNLEVSSAQRFPHYTYIIYYHPAMDSKQLRICLAHELGHLFLVLLNRKPEEYRSQESEALSWVFAALAIFDKNDFYMAKDKDFIHRNINALVADFRLIIEREEKLSSEPQ